MPRNYITIAPTGNYEQTPPSIRYGEYSYAPVPVSYPPSGYVGSNLHLYGNLEKQERDNYVCEEEVYPSNEDVKPSIASTTSAFNIVPAPPRYGSRAVSRSEENMESNMATTSSFHASTYSAFSPFASDNSSPVNQSPTQVAQSPLL